MSILSEGREWTHLESYRLGIYPVPGSKYKRCAIQPSQGALDGKNDRAFFLTPHQSPTLEYTPQ